MDLLLPTNLDLSQSRCSVTETTLAGARAFILDNGTLRLSVLPEYGGRICSLFYRPGNLEVLATEFVHVARKALTVRGGWCAAFPALLAEGECLSHARWDAEIHEASDACVSVRLTCLLDRVSHIVGGRVRVTPGTIIVERIIRLVAGEAAVSVDEVLTNRNVWPMNTVWSGVVSLRAQAGDRVVLPIEGVEVQRGVGPSGNELDFGLLVTTPYQALARNLHEGWLGFRPAAAPVDIRLSFPREHLPHAVIAAQRDEAHPVENAFRLQPLAVDRPMAEDVRDGALTLAPRQPLHLPLRLEVGAGIITGGDWSRPGLELANLITGQRVPPGRVAIWRIGALGIALKTPQLLLLMMPDTGEGALLAPEDVAAVNLMACTAPPPRAVLRRLVARTPARFIGPISLRRALLTDGVPEERSVALSPGARFDVPGLGLLATPARTDQPDEQLGFLLQADHLLLYHAGPTQFLGEFGAIGEQFRPNLVFLPLAEMSPNDAVHAARLLQPRLVVPLGAEEAERDFAERCRALHMPFAVESLYQAEGRMFDGWRLRGLGTPEA